METKEKKDNQAAKLSARQYINIDFNKIAKRILIIGNTENMFGQYTFLKDANCYSVETDNMAKEAYDALDYFIDRLENKARIDIIGNADTINYYNRMFGYLLDIELIKKSEFKNVKIKEVQNDNEYLTFMDTIKEQNIEYDFIIQNPPYSGSLHLEFLKKGLDILKKDSGKMTIIEPATWLINIRKNGKAKLYDEIKAKLNGHVSKVIVENYNIEFRTDLYMPFSVTYIDFSKEYENIEFNCFGETRIVNSLYDCNLIGDYNIIWSILNKVLTYGDMMEDHIYDKKTQKEDMWYCKYAEVIGGQLCALFDAKRRDVTTIDAANFDFGDPKNDIIFENNGVQPYPQTYYACGYHRYKNKIINKPHNSYDKGRKETDKIADCLVDTKEHLENWKHFIFNNKLPLFINMCLTIDQHNNSKPFLPWLVDKHYTDDDINKMFGFTEEEVALIDKTLKKYERHSPWFRRYMCGKDSVSSEEVQKFIDNL